LVHAAQDFGRPIDLSDVEVVGEKIEAVASRHEYAFPYTDDGTLPKPLEKMGIKGLSYPKYDQTICTYCSGFTTVMLMAIASAWRKPWDEIEILTGRHEAAWKEEDDFDRKVHVSGQQEQCRHQGDDRYQGVSSRSKGSHECPSPGGH
jgi:hypothetical protein